MIDLAQLFTAETVRRFDEEYLPRLEAAVRALPPEKLWWRPHERCTSVGNLLLHLEGNVRQWLLGGLGGASQTRQRSVEFRAQEGADVETLLAALRATVEGGCAVVECLDDVALAATYTIQGFRVTGLAAAYHVLEHFGWHVGQIVWIAKATTGPEHGIAFYDDAKL